VGTWTLIHGKSSGQNGEKWRQWLAIKLSLGFRLDCFLILILSFPFWTKIKQFARLGGKQGNSGTLSGAFYLTSYPTEKTSIVGVFSAMPQFEATFGLWGASFFSGLLKKVLIPIRRPHSLRLYFLGIH